MEIVPKTGFCCVFEAAGKTKPPGAMPGDSSCIIGDPDGGFGAQRTWSFALALSGRRLLRVGAFVARQLLVQRIAS